MRQAGAPTRRPHAGQEASDARHGSLGLALILVASFMVVLDFSIVNVALPSIETELGLAASAVQWVITGYAITFGGLLILGGRAADLFGRRRMFVARFLCCGVITPDSTRTLSCMMTCVAPSGICAPVKIRAHSPRLILSFGTAPG